MNQRYIKINGIDYFSNSGVYTLADVKISELTKKKVIYEPPGKQEYVDLSYFYQNANIYENRTIIAEVIVQGKGTTEIDRENDAYAKIQALNSQILDLVGDINIEVSKYQGYVFRGIPLKMVLEQKGEADELSVHKVTYHFLVGPIATITLDGCYPIKYVTKGKCGSQMKTNIALGRNTIMVNLDRVKPVYISTVGGFISNYTINIEGTDVLITSDSFMLDSLYFTAGINIITCPTDTDYQIKFDLEIL